MVGVLWVAVRLARRAPRARCARDGVERLLAHVGRRRRLRHRDRARPGRRLRWHGGRVRHGSARLLSRDARAAGVGGAAIDAGVAPGPFRCPGVCRLIGSRPAIGCGCGCARAVGRRRWRRAARSWPRVCACARSGCFASAPMRPRRAWCWCGATRSTTQRRCAGRVADARERCRCGIRSRSGSMRRARSCRSRCSSATCCSAASRAPGSRWRCRSWWPRQRSTRSRACGCSDGKLVELAAWAPVAQRRRRPRRRRCDRAAARGAARRWTRAIASCSRAGCGRSAATTGLPLHLVVCDELAFYLTLPDKRATPGVHRAAARPGRAWSRGRRDRVRGDAEAGRGRRADGVAGSVRVPARVALQHAAGVGHDPRPGLGVGRRRRVDDPGRAARRRATCSPRASGRSGSRASTSTTTTCRRSPSAPPRGALMRGSRRIRRPAERETASGSERRPWRSPSSDRPVRAGARRRCSRARRTRSSGSASSARCARLATAVSRCGCAGRSTRSTSRPASAARSYSTEPEPDRHAAEVLRQSPRGGLPVVRGDLPWRRLPARRGWPAWRQGRAGVGARASDGVRDADGAELRAGAFAPRWPDGRPQRCRPRRALDVCPHGVRLSCGEVHDEDDPRLGEPLCPDCFDYEHAVLWNALAPELWRRTAIQIPRELARLAGVSHRELRRRVRVSYVKVAEYQRRGVAALPLRDPARSRAAARSADRSSRRPRSSRASCSARRCAPPSDVYRSPPPHPTTRPRRGGREVRWGLELEVRRARTPARPRRGGGVCRRTSRSTRRSPPRPSAG